MPSQKQQPKRRSQPRKKGPVERRTELVKLECARCGRKATATVLRVFPRSYVDKLSPLWTWVRLPPRWWVLLSPESIHVRCPECLKT
jgi:hypothetical protein